jgi:hypothetical protein
LVVKILLVHNFYGSSAPSGENTAFVAEAALLKSEGPPGNAEVYGPIGNRKVHIKGFI